MTSNSWCPSAIPAWGCPCSRRTRSSTRSLPRSFTGPAWDCPSAAPSLNRIAAACGLPTTLRAAQVFTSCCLPTLERQPERSEPAVRYVPHGVEAESENDCGEKAETPVDVPCEQVGEKERLERPVDPDSGVSTRWRLR